MSDGKFRSIEFDSVANADYVTPPDLFEQGRPPPPPPLDLICGPS